MGEVDSLLQSSHKLAWDVEKQKEDTQGELKELRVWGLPTPTQ